MTLEQYAYLAEIIGVIIVVVTLVYLSLQVRQGANLMRSEARQAQVSADLDIIYKWMEWPDIQESVPLCQDSCRVCFWENRVTGVGKRVRNGTVQ